jgi:hypothetical protein
MVKSRTLAQAVIESGHVVAVLSRLKADGGRSRKSRITAFGSWESAIDANRSGLITGAVKPARSSGGPKRARSW